MQRVITTSHMIAEQIVYTKAVTLIISEKVGPHQSFCRPAGHLKRPLPEGYANKASIAAAHTTVSFSAIPNDDTRQRAFLQGFGWP